MFAGLISIIAETLKRRFGVEQVTLEEFLITGTFDHLFIISNISSVIILILWINVHSTTLDDILKLPALQSSVFTSFFFNNSRLNIR